MSHKVPREAQYKNTDDRRVEGKAMAPVEEALSAPPPLNVEPHISEGITSIPQSTAPRFDMSPTHDLEDIESASLLSPLQAKLGKDGKASSKMQKAKQEGELDEDTRMADASSPLTLSCNQVVVGCAVGLVTLLLWMAGHHGQRGGSAHLARDVGMLALPRNNTYAIHADRPHIFHPKSSHLNGFDAKSHWSKFREQHASLQVKKSGENQTLKDAAHTVHNTNNEDNSIHASNATADSNHSNAHRSQSSHSKHRSANHLFGMLHKVDKSHNNKGFGKLGGSLHRKNDADVAIREASKQVQGRDSVGGKGGGIGAGMTPTCTGQVGVRRGPGQEDLPDISKLTVGAVDAGTCGMKCESGTIHCLPQGIVIGEAKCGTSEIRLWLQNHPKIRFAYGEPNFFSDKPAQMFHSYLEKTKRWKFSQQDLDQNVIGMEKSPRYSQAYCQAAASIKKLIPSVRLVLSLRDPASRAYSGFRQHCRMKRLVLTKEDRVQRCDVPGGKYYTCHVADPGEVVRRLINKNGDCSAENFHKYILAQKTRFEEQGLSIEDFRKKAESGGECLQADTYFGEQILSHSLYSSTLVEYYKHFDKDQLLVVFMEEFVSDPQSFMDRIQSHVGVEHHRFETTRGGNGYWLLKGHESQSKSQKMEAKHDEMKAETRDWLTKFYDVEVNRLRELLPDLSLHFDKWTVSTS